MEQENMSDQPKALLTIHYVNGEHHSFQYTPETDQYTMGDSISKALHENILLIELESKVLAVPFQNIQHIEISPRPLKLPAQVIKNAQMIS